ncbi:Uncharacterised protein [Legionella geestiana]|nr:Uncharacterised protein [Legionella geestiana]
MAAHSRQLSLITVIIRPDFLLHLYSHKEL